MKTEFRKQLEQLINKESMENGSDTPDFILADYLMGCLENFDKTLQSREKWYGRTVGGLKSVNTPISMSNSFELTDDSF